MANNAFVSAQNMNVPLYLKQAMKNQALIKET